MKTLGRIAILLVAALIVTAAMLAFGQSTQASSIVNSLSGRAGFEQRGAGRRAHAEMQLPQGQTAGQPSANFEGFEGRGGGEGGEMGGFNIAGVQPFLKNSIIVAGIVFVFVVIALGWRMLRRGSRKPKTNPIA